MRIRKARGGVRIDVDEVEAGVVEDVGEQLGRELL